MFAVMLYNVISVSYNYFMHNKTRRCHIQQDKTIQDITRHDKETWQRTTSQGKTRLNKWRQWKCGLDINRHNNTRKYTPTLHKPTLHSKILVQIRQYKTRLGVPCVSNLSRFVLLLCCVPIFPYAWRVFLYVRRSRRSPTIMSLVMLSNHKVLHWNKIRQDKTKTKH